MANLLQYATLFQQELDKQIVAQATSGWMEANAGKVIYNGGNTVKIPIMSMDGLGNYDRSGGFVPGSVTLNYETKTLTQDRGRTFSLDSMDVNETNFVASAGAVMGEFQRTKVIPEIDAYRYSSIAAQAIAKGKASNGYTATETDVLKALKADIADIQDLVGENVPLVITLSGAVAKILENSTELSKQLSVIDFTAGIINGKVKAIDDVPILKVPSLRMKTAYVFNDGKTAGQTTGGITAASGAKNINWIITPKAAPIAVSKTDKIRIFEPDTNQSADAWKLDYRKYHDLWILDNSFDAIKVNIKEA